MSLSTSLEVAQREVAGALDRQGGEDDALDVKTGLVLALDAAALVGILTVARKGEPAESFFWIALLLVVLSTGGSLLALVPRGLQHPPEPFAFALAYGGSKSVPVQEVVRLLMNAQLRAWDLNNQLLARKLRLFVMAAAWAVGGIASFVLQAIFGV